ncbi:MAG: UDP-N-acetylmuramate dehydrogenase [Bifidobacteriaceae bacterium]|nr:UDP-N-acetylmuramate dehydrogenase [Bifidobacteriaceae bacterium]
MERLDLPLASPLVGPGASLAELTTFRIGGRPGRLVDCHTEADLTEAVREADVAGEALLVIGGGSNLLAAEDPGGLTVVRDRRGDVRAEEEGGRVLVTAAAGVAWDALVEWAVGRGWTGLEALSGIPGSVGAAPVQNIGAYGAEVGQAIESVRALDRLAGKIVRLGAAELGFSYRDSALKRSLGRMAGPTPRWVVLDVTFGIDAGTNAGAAAVRHDQLAAALGVRVGEAAELAAVRRAVLSIRRGKGMVLDPADHDTWSAGSFFTNPLVSAVVAGELPPAAPRFPAEGGLVKLSAAWLISNSGVGRGEGVRAGARATTSSKHVLALTNRGGATSADVLELADWIAARVADRFGVRLTPEPVIVPPAGPR